MLRHLGFIAVCACAITSAGCEEGNRIKGIPPSPPSTPMVTVEFGGRVVNADVGGPVGNVRVSLQALSSASGGLRLASADETATSDGDGRFTLTLTIPSDWRMVGLRFTAPPGYDDTHGRVEPTANPCGLAPCWAAAARPEIPMYPTLSIRRGESIEVRVGGSKVWCGWDGYPCRRVLIEASPGDPVELEVVSHDSSRQMALGLATPGNSSYFEPDMSVRRLLVPSGGVPFVVSEYDTGTATLTAR